MPNPAMAATSSDDLVTMAALGDEEAKKALEEQAAQLNKGTDPADPAAPMWTAEQLAKAQAAGATPLAPPVKQGAEQARADGGQQAAGDAVLNKADEQGDDEDDDAYKERMEKKCVEKSMDEVTPEEEALIKAMDIAEGIARGATTDPDPDRREVLAKSYADGTIDEDGRAELFELLKSEMPAGDSVDLDDPDLGDDALNKGFTDAALSDPAIEAGHVDEDGVDVSGYLGRLSAFVGGALDTINTDLAKGNEDLAKSLDRVHQYNLASTKANRALAGIVMRQEKMIKSLSAQNNALGARIETVEETPQQRRTVPTAQALEKSLDAPGADGQGSGIPRDTMTKGFQLLMQKSIKGDGENGFAPCGRDITIDTAHYESHGKIHPDMLADVKNVLGK